ncbi:MAG: nuclear transport factor 2 family protein [Acidobacteria bacterium]|nr:nuclear transport factor 2 family protein [Acidobacteriota bacterium]
MNPVAPRSVTSFFGNGCVVIGRSTVKGQDKGQDISGQYRYTRVYVKRQRRWQLVANQSTRLAAA